MDSYRDSRDSTSLSRLDLQPPPRPPRNDVAGTSRSLNGRLEPVATTLSPISPGSETEISPAAAAIAAVFQNAITRRRGMSDADLADEEYGRQREKETAIQMDRQRRIREKVPGMKVTKTRAGDIDGECRRILSDMTLSLHTSCSGRNQG